MNEKLEWEALKIVLQKSNKPKCHTGRCIYKLLAGDIVKDERPDFIISTNDQKIGIEHFLIPTVTRGEKYPLNIWEVNECLNLYKQYEGNKEIIDLDIDNGVLPKKIESLVNEIINISNTFLYTNFIERFRNALGGDGNHVKSIDFYSKKCDKLGFLIELPDISEGMYRLNGNPMLQRFAIMPFSYDMCSCIDVLFTKHENLQFVIFVFDRDKVLYLASDTWRNDLKAQNVHICKYFDIKRINRKLQLSVK